MAGLPRELIELVLLKAPGFNIGPLKGDFLRRANKTLLPIASVVSSVLPDRLRTPDVNTFMLGVAGSTFKEVCGLRPTERVPGECIVLVS